MNRFDFTMGSTIFFGEGRLEEIGDIVSRDFGNSRVLLLAGNHSKKAGLIERVKNKLNKSFVEVSVCIVEGKGAKCTEIDDLAMSLNSKSEYELIIAMGGGSVIDVAKALATVIRSSNKIWDFVEGRIAVYKPIPILAVVTNPASGSECNGSAVITNEELRVKRGLSCPCLIPKYAILDPELTCSLPREETIRSSVDILFHSLERFLSSDNSITSVSDNMAISVIKNTMSYLPKVLANPNDINARGEILWCGSCSNSGLTGLGKNIEFPIHQLGHQISAFYDVPHADSLTAIWKAWATHVMNKNYSKFAELGKVLFGLLGEDKTIAKETIDSLDAFWQMNGMPTSLTECCGNISEEERFKLINSITHNGKRVIGRFWKLTHEDVCKIINIATKE